MSACDSLGFCVECEYAQPSHSATCPHNQEIIEQIKALLSRYLGEDSPHDISNMASNIHKIYRDF